MMSELELIELRRMLKKFISEYDYRIESAYKLVRDIDSAIVGDFEPIILGE